ncbi:unnamed protein product [Durusdinium trenchii]|uniref:Secreted protein n=1 Tax=Durusdinium trenchii TaxID=1381693 RepID=A0ABP0K4W0_9DINO
MSCVFVCEISFFAFVILLVAVGIFGFKAGAVLRALVLMELQLLLKQLRQGSKWFVFFFTGELACLEVSIKRRFMRENKDQAPGTLRSVQCCGAQPERPEGSGRSRAGPDRNRTRGAFRWSGPEEVG